MQGIVEIHGGGLNGSFIEKIALTEAWMLIISECFRVFQVVSINTSCMITNSKAYKFIRGTGFKEISREQDKNRIDFKLEHRDFEKNDTKKLIKNRILSHKENPDLNNNVLHRTN